jgi:hypothetical protein
LVSALLAIVYAAVILVVGELYIVNRKASDNLGGAKQRDPCDTCGALVPLTAYGTYGSLRS